MPSRLTLSLAALLLVAAPLAGCIGGDDQQEDGVDNASQNAIDGGNASVPANETFPSANDQAEQDGGDDGESDPTRKLVSYEGIDEPFKETIQEEGSFATHESCAGGGCWTQFATGSESYIERYDVTSQAPTNVPVQVDVNVTWDSNNDFYFSGSMFAYVEAVDGTVFTYDQGYDYENDTQHAWASALVVIDQQSDLYGVVGSSLAEPPSQDYEVEITLQADPYSIPEEVPVAVPLEESEMDPLVGIQEQASDVELRIWGPEDQIQYQPKGLNPGQPFALEDVESGEHVLAAFGAPEPARLAVTSEVSTEMRALPLSVTYGDPTAVSNDGQAQWDATIDYAPYSVGVYIQSDSEAYSYNDGEVSFSSPEGTVVTMESGSCLLCMSQGSAVTAAWVSSPVNDDIVPGDWTGEASFQTAANIEVGHFTVDYRP